MKMTIFRGAVDSRSCQFLKALLLNVLIVTGGFCLEFEKENSGCIEKERQALLNFKKGLVDYYNLLSSWNISGDKDCFRWKGISCNNKIGHVTMVDLRSVIHSSCDTGDSWAPVSGEIGPSLLELRYLTHLDLSYNAFSSIPEFIGSLTELKYLNLSRNSFSGTIPPQLGNISMLRTLDLSWNNFSGIIPNQLGNLSRMISLNLNFNMGTMIVENFEWLPGLSSLRILKMSRVNFTKSPNWLQSIKLNPSLSSIYLVACQFPAVDSSSLSHVNSSNTLDLFSQIRIIFFSY